MPLSARRHNRSPVLGDTPDVPRDITNLANDLDDAPAYARGILSFRPVSGRFTGDIYWSTDDFTMSPLGTPAIWNGSSWQQWSPPSNPANATPGSRSLGYAAGQALPGNDATVTNARTPIAHAASHRQGGSDKIGGIVPVGGMIDYWGSADPTDTDWAIPDGRALNASADPTLITLYNLIGITHGGTGVSNFLLPNPRGRFMLMQGTAAPAVNGGTAHTMAQKGGEETHINSDGESVPHTHFFYSPVGFNGGSGATDPVPMSAPYMPAFTPVGGFGGGYTLSHVEPAMIGTRLGGGSQAIEIWQVSTTGFQNVGAATAHNNMPPFMVANKIMRIR